MRRPSARLRPIVLALFSTSTDSPLNREAARLLAYLDEPAAVPLDRASTRRRSRT